LSNIRVTYSGLIALVVGFASVITGIIFTLIITRRLSPEEFGLWAIIGTMISYFMIAEPIISYWSTRQIARGEQVGKTSLISSTIFSFAGIPIYLVLSFVISDTTDTEFNVILLGVLLLPISFISQSLVGINLGHKPHATSYGLLGFEIVKIPAGLALVYFLDLGVSGAIFATAIAFSIKILIQIYFAREKIRTKFSLDVVRRWIKLSWIPLYSNISHVVWSLDLILYVTIIGSTVGIALYVVSLTISSIINHSGLISNALYPKLISDGSKSHVSDNFLRLLYFAIPLLAISILFSKPALFALNPVYAGASLVVIFVSIRAFFYVLTGVFYQVLKGIETIDVEKNPTYKDLAKSKLFHVPTVELIHHIIYIITISLLFIVLNYLDFSELDIVSWWTFIMVVLQIPFFIYALIQIKKYIVFSIPTITVLKYIFATMMFVIVFLFTSESIINYKISIYEFLPSLIIQLILCIGVYALITFLIDKNTQKLFKLIISEIKST
jgi:hypothetical protein